MRVLGWGKPLGYDTPSRVEPHHAILSVRFGAHRTACKGSYSSSGEIDQWEFIFEQFISSSAVDAITDRQLGMLIGPGSSVCKGCKDAIDAAAFESFGLGAH